MTTGPPVLKEPPAVPHGAAVLHPISQQLHEKRTNGERLADAIAHHIGSWRFLTIQTILVLCWIAVNIVAVAARWDAYPFVLLNLLFSVQAAYTGRCCCSRRTAQRSATG